MRYRFIPTVGTPPAYYVDADTDTEALALAEGIATKEVPILVCAFPEGNLVRQVATVPQPKGFRR